MKTALDHHSIGTNLTAAPFPYSETNDIWMNVQNASLNKQQYEACVSILHKTYELQPSESLTPLPFSVKEFTDYLAGFIHSRFPAPHTTIRGFIAGGAAVHVLTGREYGDINIRFYFNHPEPLHIVREGVFDYFIQKLRQIQGVEFDESSLSKLLHAYISKTILRDGNPTSFAWFGLGWIEVWERNNYQVGREAILESLDLDPNGPQNGRKYVALAGSYLGEGKLEQAEDAIEKSLLSNVNWPASVIQASIKAQLGQVETGNSIIETVMKKYPDISIDKFIINYTNQGRAKEEVAKGLEKLDFNGVGP